MLVVTYFSVQTNPSAIITHNLLIIQHVLNGYQLCFTSYQKNPIDIINCVWSLGSLVNHETPCPSEVKSDLCILWNSARMISDDL